MTDKKVAALLVKQHSLNESMQETMRIFKARPPGPPPEAYVRAKLAGLEALWSDFKANHEQLLALFTTETLPQEEYFKLNTYSKAEDRYCEYVAQFQEHLPARSTVVDQGGNGGKPKIKLPIINVPTFDGNLQDWYNFRNLFRTLIHDREDLTDVERLQYLKGFVKGEASNIIKHFDVTDSNYKSAWSLISDRYENPRLMIDALLTKITTLPALKSESILAFKNMVDTVNECLYSLSSLNVSVSTWDPILIHLLVPKLPMVTIKEWDKEVGSSKTSPALAKFLGFLTNVFQTMESSKRFGTGMSTSSGSPTNASKVRTFLTSAREVKLCPLCQADHTIRKCPAFLQMTVQGRLDFLKNKQICRNCLSFYHNTTQCSSSVTCKHCQCRHHSLIHIPRRQESPSPGAGTAANTNTRIPSATLESSRGTTQPRDAADRTIPSPNTDSSQNWESSPRSNQMSNCYTGTIHRTTASRGINLLATVVLHVWHRGRSIPVRALVDPGSQATFVTTRVVQMLSAATEPVSVQISGLGGIHIGTPLSRVVLDIRSNANPDFTLTTEMFVLPKLTQLLPPSQIKLPDIAQYRQLPLADPQFDKPGPIDMLLGVEVYAKILLPGLHYLPNNLLMQSTRLGWIVFGSPLEEGSQTDQSRITITGLHTYVEDDTALKRFWESESVPSESSNPMLIDPSELHYTANTIRLSDGRYQVKLPFRNQDGLLGRSAHIAKAAYFRMEKRLLQTPVLYQQYQDCLRDYVSMGHMQLAKTSEKQHMLSDEERRNYRCFYMPHHAVLKDSSTTKLRVVFNASQKTENGKSLNDILYTGPRLQKDLVILLIQWRLYPIAVTADIAKMYRQIWIDPSDQPYQKILWRDDPTTPLAEYELRTVTFGVTTAPYLAIRTLLQLATDEEARFPQAAKQLRENFYVDDYLGGAFDVTTASRSIHDLRTVLNRGGFNLRKWLSSHSEVLNNMPAEDREKIHSESTTVPVIKTLGVGWNPPLDHLHFNIPPFSMPTLVSKRVILSWIAGLYDPLGLLAPVIIIYKLFMQRLWLSGLNWDEPVGESLLSEWISITQSCQTSHPMIIPRWLGFKPTHNMELHGFCDASKRAYAAVIYLRVTDSAGLVNCNLLLSKTRVAPTKSVTIPRLELCGAVLLVKVLQYLRRQFSVLDLPYVLWTDSQVVLAWLRRDPSNWTTFVANRVSFIQTYTTPSSWRHVSSIDNPADLATRGLSGTQLINNEMWWSGPIWLTEPTYDRNLKSIEDLPIETEWEPDVIVSYQTIVTIPWLEKFSTLTRLLRVTAYVLRFLHFKKRDRPKSTLLTLSSAEIDEARRYCITFVQQASFAAELHALSRGTPISSKSPLLTLNPIIGSDGLIRVGGRLSHSDLPYEEQHPIILPSDHAFTTLVIRHAHAQTMHGGTELTSAYIRARYWILHTRSAIRRILHQCVICFRHKRHSAEQMMGDLPRERVIIARPFTYTGVDYAGPVVLKSVGIRSTKTFKGYIALFVCFTTKAYHLELVSALSTEAFLAAFQRFISRRGLPHTLYSDCGTNFVGAHNSLQRFKREVSEFGATRGINWRFIPPASPHFGGLWEAGVKLVKTHLKRMLGTTLLTFEEYATLLAQIEACLNSRPLCPISNDSRDYAVLTPGHFLTGSNLLSPPLPDYSTTPSNHLRRWQRVQQLYQLFWKRWSTDYLSRQQPRPKWKRATPNLQENDLVLIQEERLAPLYWRLGRIVSTIQGSDQLVRVVEIQTADGVIKRPITKLFKLPSADTAYLSNHHLSWA